MADGKVEIDVDLNSRNVGSQSASLGSKLKSGVGKATGATVKMVAAVGTAATAALGTATTMAVKSYSDYEQLTGGIETLFKKSYNQVMKYANNAYKTAGMSANEYMETATSFSASLLQGLKGDTEKAAKYADQAITDMSDNANKMGTDISMIQNAYQGFAKQNYTMLDNLKLGYGGTAAEMARLVNDSGVMGDKFKATAKNLNKVSFDKMIDAIHTVQNNLGITGTTAKEASDTIEGSVNSMKASWQNLLTGMADGNQNFDELFDKFIDSVHTVMKNIEPIALQAASSCAKLVAGALDEIAAMVPKIAKKLPGMVMPIVSSFGDIGLELIGALLGDQVKNGLESFVNEFSKQIPIIVKQGSIGLELLRKHFSNLINMILKIASAALPPLVSGFSFLMEHIEMLSPLLATVFDTFEIAVGIIPQVVSALSPLIAVVLNAASFVVPLLTSVLKVLNDNFNWLIPTITKILRSIDISPIEKLFDVISKNAIPIVKNLFGIIQQVARIATTVITAVIKAIKPLLTVVTNVASYIVPLLSSVVEFLNENLYLLVPALGAVASAMAALWVANNWQAIILTVAQMLESVLAPVIIKLFALIAAHPLMTIITGITALTAAIVYFNDTASETSIEAQGIREQAEQLNTTLEESKARWDDLISSYQQMQEQSAQRISDTALEMDQARSYWDELQKITDENGKIKKGYEDRAAYITGELSSALGTEITITDNQVQGYKDLQKNIKKTIVQKQLEATIDAKTAEYNEAKSQSVTLAAEIAQKETEVAEAKKKFEDAQKKANKATEEGAEDAGELRKAAGELGASYSNMNEDLKESTNQFNNMKATISNYDKAINSVGKGTKEMKKAQKALADNTKQYGKASTDSLKAQADEAVEQYDKIKKAYDNGSKAITKEEVKNAKVAAETSLKEYKKCGKEAVQGYINGINERKGELSSAVVTMVNEALKSGKKAAKIHSPSKLTTQDGKFIADGYAEGFIKNDPARRITQTFRHSMRSINNAMNGEVIHTMRMGSMDSIGDAMVRSLQRAGLTVSIDGRQFGRIVKGAVQ